jgi:superfamily II DNA or RNA helicase
MDETEIKQRKINLKINGRLFPSYIDKNFKEYELEEEIRDLTIDRCNLDTKKEKKELKKYQEFVSKYMDNNTNNQSILLYHGLGTGKTRTIINLYEMLYRNNPHYNVFLIIKAGLKQKWIEEFEKWLKDKDIYKNIFIVHLDSPFFGNDFEKKRNESDAAKKNIYFIDEVHLFISHVVNNIESEKGSKNSLSVYQSILRDKIDNDCKIILASATPFREKPFESALLFNLLRPNLFPSTEIQFNKIFITDNNGIKTLNPIMKNSYQRRIMGLVSYYQPQNDLYATKKIIFQDVKMSAYQSEMYKFYEKLEYDMMRKSTNSKSYRIYTRQASNFVFPNINAQVNAQARPRPNNFKISESDYEKISSENDSEIKKNITNYDAYLEMLQFYESTTEKYFDKIYESDKNEKHNIETDMKNFDKYDTFDEFMDGEKHKSKLFNELYDCSCKYMALIFNVSKSEHVVMIYTFFITMEGLHMLKIYLKYFGYSSFTNPKSKDYYRYGEITGEISKEDKEKTVKLEQNIDNLDGKLMKLIFFSGAGTEGIDLYNITQEHIIEPFWNESNIFQVIGRGIRMCSHKNLPMDKRHVDVYRYKSIKHNVQSKNIEINGKVKIEHELITDENLLKTVDYDIENRARSKNNLLESFLEPVREVAVDCNLFKKHNMVNSKYKCFKFNQNSLFDKNIGPAYKDDIIEDMKIDNGLNSTKSIVVKIKVIKIKGLLEKTMLFYWYDMKTGIVYDFELHYPVGKVKRENNIPVKLDVDTYEIDGLFIPALQ